MLTTTQKATLKTAIAAELDPVFVSYRTAGATGQMAEWFNQPSTVTVWRTSVPKDEITMNGFDWTRLDNLTVGKARVWDGLFDNASRITNPSKPNVRAGIDTVWSGITADLAVRAAVYVHCKRFATRAEKLFATGLGTDAAPSIMGFEGQISDQDVVRAIND
ncbi:MAG: hypothetical protein Q8N06_02810 [Hydrogenophaga sp.]|nr:hypothetical protein [Hydrogenophaga sp.]